MPKKITLPTSFLRKLKQTFTSQQIDLIMEGFQATRPTTFRVNTLKTTAKKIAAQLNNLEIKYQLLDWPENTFILPDEKKRLIETEMYSNGLIYVQSLASLLPPILLSPQPYENLLDLTATPGSKTTQMAAMMKNTGRIIANDRHLIRSEKLKYNLQKQGVENTTVTNLLGQEIGAKYPGFFDRTLLDAPCSLEGTFNLNKPKSFQNWSPELVAALSQRQKDLLYSAYQATKPGGIIVYSTCTLSPEENEAVVNWLLEKTGKKVAVKKIDLDIPDSIPGFTKWANQTFHPSLKNTLRILPSPLFEGFYLAKLTKIS